MLGLNILMFGTLFLLIRVIQRMNKFEKVNKCNHKILKQSIFFQILRLSRDPWPELNLYKTSNSSLVYGKSAATSRIHGAKRQQLLFSISFSNNTNRIGHFKKEIGM